MSLSFPRSRPGVILALAAGAILAYGAAVAVINRMPAHPRLQSIGPIAAMPTLPAGALTVMTWNIGYGGLGAESEFFADGGKEMLPPGKAIVEKNVAGIVSLLNKNAPDAILMQETARASLLTRGVDTLGAVVGALKGRDNAFSADLAARLLPPPFNIRNGLFTSISWGGARRELYELPREPNFIFGLFKRRYHAQVVRVPVDGDAADWVLIDIHLSAFDEGANVRLAQLREVLKLAEAEYEKGARVVVGGDWNYEFARPDTLSTTKEKFLFWLHAFPYLELKAGWTAAFDPEIPTCRTNERPYARGENFTTIIDGFIVSPNVEVVEVRAIDLDFQYTDHQPVVARFRAR